MIQSSTFVKVERARWNIMENITTGSIPASICSLPCGMGEIKNFEVSFSSIYYTYEF